MSKAQLSQSRLLASVAWLSIPLLAVLAFAPVLTLWFVGDDFGNLLWQERVPWPGPFTMFAGGEMFYRPLSISITWEFLFSLFGTNALPYHAISLTLHSLAALLLGLVAVAISGDLRVGWLAGALFAVYPLSTEPVAWLASQWDLWAAVCALAAVWGFTVAWKTHRRLPYIVGLVAALAGVFMKESILPLPLILPFVAIATEMSGNTNEDGMAPKQLSKLLGRTVLWALPFAIPSTLFAGLRIATGGIGGYSGVRTDYQHFLLGAIPAVWLQMTMPLNLSLFSSLVAQVMGLFITAVFLGGLVLRGRRRWALLLLAFSWWLVFLMPVFNLIIIDNPEVSGNRIYYLSLMGFCLGLAVLLIDLVDTLKLGAVGWAFVVAALLLAIPVTWVQLQPWVQSSRQTRRILDEMAHLIGPQDHRVQINVQDLPKAYKGSYVFWNGFHDALVIFNGQRAVVREVGELASPDLLQPLTQTVGAYNLAFSLDKEDQLYHVSQLSGVTLPNSAPVGQLQIWNYSQCKDVSLGWQPRDATFECAAQADSPPQPGVSYAIFNPATDDGSLIATHSPMDLSSARWLRLAVCARLPANRDQLVGEWFWADETDQGWSQDRSHSFFLDSTGVWRVYWTYIPSGRVGRQLSGLRFDPVNGKMPVEILWIAATSIQ